MLYRHLNVKPTATAEEIRHSYRQLVLKVHPDKPGGSHEAFKEVQKAYEILSDEARRKAYDDEVGGKRKCLKGFRRPPPLSQVHRPVHFRLADEEYYTFETAPSHLRCSLRHGDIIACKDDTGCFIGIAGDGAYYWCKDGHTHATQLCSASFGATGVTVLYHANLPSGNDALRPPRSNPGGSGTNVRVDSTIPKYDLNGKRVKHEYERTPMYRNMTEEEKLKFIILRAEVTRKYEKKFQALLQRESLRREQFYTAVDQWFSDRIAKFEERSAEIEVTVRRTRWNAFLPVQPPPEPADGSEIAESDATTSIKSPDVEEPPHLSATLSIHAHRSLFVEGKLSDADSCHEGSATKHQLDLAPEATTTEAAVKQAAPSSSRSSSSSVVVEQKEEQHGVLPAESVCDNVTAPAHGDSVDNVVPGASVAQPNDLRVLNDCSSAEKNDCSSCDSRETGCSDFCPTGTDDPHDRMRVHTHSLRGADKLEATCKPPELRETPKGTVTPLKLIVSATPEKPREVPSVSAEGASPPAASAPAAARGTRSKEVPSRSPERSRRVKAKAGAGVKQSSSRKAVSPVALRPPPHGSTTQQKAPSIKQTRSTVLRAAATNYCRPGMTHVDPVAHYDISGVGMNAGNKGGDSGGDAKHRRAIDMSVDELWALEEEFINLVQSRSTVLGGKGGARDRRV